MNYIFLIMIIQFATGSKKVNSGKGKAMNLKPEIPHFEKVGSGGFFISGWKSS
jgi:hypothetical protein